MKTTSTKYCIVVELEDGEREVIIMHSTGQDNRTHWAIMIAAFAGDLFMQQSGTCAADRFLINIENALHTFHVDTVEGILKEVGCSLEIDRINKTK